MHALCHNGCVSIVEKTSSIEQRCVLGNERYAVCRVGGSGVVVVMVVVMVTEGLVVTVLLRYPSRSTHPFI